ncbi:MAG: serine--tRNA ligase [Patescibacteria group bacterium]
MLDIKFIRENKDLVAFGAKKKNIKFDVDALLSLDDKRKELILAVEELRKKQNEATNLISLKTYQNEKLRLIQEMKPLKKELQGKESELAEVIKSWQMLMVSVPNIPDVSVPEGESDADNLETKVWGEIPKFDFEPKSHVELMTSLKMLDLERGTKVAGFRGYFLKNDGARLQFALWQFLNDFFLKKGGFSPMIVPSLIKREPFVGTGYLPQSEEDLYKTQDGEYLSGTAEVATMGYFMDEVIDKKDLPIKILAFSPAFRREAGSHGKDTKGIMRVHEFYKFEQVVLCEASHETSVALHEEITANAEEIMQALKLPYRIVINCGGDLGLGQVKKYDIEAWVPSEKKYRETHSSSYFHDFQTRRLNIKYRDNDPAVAGGQTKLKFVHSLNNTALSGRPMIAIMENYQQADGRVKIPEVLRPYLGDKEFFG